MHHKYITRAKHTHKYMFTKRKGIKPPTASQKQWSKHLERITQAFLSHINWRARQSGVVCCACAHAHLLSTNTFPLSQFYRDLCGRYELLMPYSTDVTWLWRSPVAEIAKRWFSRHPRTVVWSARWEGTWRSDQSGKSSLEAEKCDNSHPTLTLLSRHRECYTDIRVFFVRTVRGRWRRDASDRWVTELFQWKHELGLMECLQTISFF